MVLRNKGRFFAALLLVFEACTLPNVFAETGQALPLVQLPGVGAIRIEVYAPGVFRLRQGDVHSDANNLMERYQIYPAALSQVVSRFERDASGVVVTSADGSLRIDETTGAISLQRKNGKIISPSLHMLTDSSTDAAGLDLGRREKALTTLFQGTETPEAILGEPERASAGTTGKEDRVYAPRGFSITAALDPDERFYGLGTASKSHIQLRGEAYYNWVRYTEDEQPVPFLMSTAGWGMLVNTAWRHYVDVAKTDPNQLLIWAPAGDLDVFLIVGSGMPEILDRYTQISGRAILLPMWAYGVTWINHTNSNQFEVMENARHFRDSHFPVDGFGLEPGWMKKEYDFSTKIEWNVDRFYEPSWLRGSRRSPETFIGALKRLGIKLHLWLCVDYDLTGEAERRVAQRTHQPTTESAEPYFEHLKPFLDDGVVAWKLDPARLVATPDMKRRYINHHSEYEMHNLNQVLLVKQLYEGQASYTGLRPMIQYCGGWAGTQQYAAQTVGDIEGGPEGLAWMLNANMSGYMNTAVDMRVHAYIDERSHWPDGAGIHLGFLSPWTLIDGWAFPYQPWYAGKKLEAMMGDYARLRYRLLPYLYSTAYHGYRTGMPIMRPLPLMYPEDQRLKDETHEYMLGDWLLVTAFTPTVRLPAGTWTDYWTGLRYEGAREIPYTPPLNRGGGLFVRDGAILPNAAPMDYVGDQDMSVLYLDIYPAGSTSITFYEDDGLGLGYQKGEGANTLIHSSVIDNTTVIELGARTGKYEGMPLNRNTRLLIHGVRPVEVNVDGHRLAESAVGWSYDNSLKIVTVRIEQDTPLAPAHRVVLYNSHLVRKARAREAKG